MKGILKSIAVGLTAAIAAAAPTLERRDLAPLSVAPAGATTNGGRIVVFKQDTIVSNIINQLGLNLGSLLGGGLQRTLDGVLKGVAGKVGD